MATEPTIANATESPLAAAERVAPHAAELAEQIERERALPAQLRAELIEAGLFGLCLPRALGGFEAQPAEMIRAIAELARADGATAWCAAIASTSSLLGAYLPDEDARLIYAGQGRLGRCVRSARSRRAPRRRLPRTSGRWSFVSGVGHCDWVMGGCIVFNGEDPELLENGGPNVRLMLMPIDSVEVIDTWSVSGCVEPAPTTWPSRTCSCRRRAACRCPRSPARAGALYAFPLFGLLARRRRGRPGIARRGDRRADRAGGRKDAGRGPKTLAKRPSPQAEPAPRRPWGRRAR